MKRIHITPRSNIPFEERVGKINIRHTESQWIIVCDIEGKWLFDTSILDFAKEIGVTTKEVHKAIQKGIPIKGYLVDLDLF